MTRRRRVLLHAQNLSGAGHLVRATEIARALACEHDVYFAHGGASVPRSPSEHPFRLVPLPPLARVGGRLEALGRCAPLAAVLDERRERLRRAAAEIAPDVLLVEHYPFSKWELGPEVEDAIAAARRASPGVRVVCSVRDVCRQTSHERVAADVWARRVADALDARFDALLVHADPSFTVLGEHLPTAGELGIPVEHTGFVSEKARSAGPDAGGPGVVVASSGGGARGGPFASRVVAAWARLAARGRAGGRRLVVFAGAFAEAAAVERLRAEASTVGASVRPFGAGFLDALAGCELSISRAGYNTCTNLLETRVRALLVPDPAMSDQAFRAERLARHGVAAVLEDDGADPDRFADAIEAALQRDPPVHAFDLGGALRTSRLLAAL